MPDEIKSLHLKAAEHHGQPNPGGHFFPKADAPVEKVEKEQQGYQQAAEHHGQGTCPHIPAFKGAGEQLGKQIPGLEPDPQAEAGEEP